MSCSRVDLETFLIPLEEIISATQNFSPEYVIKGSKYDQPVVYRGRLSERWKNRMAAFTRYGPRYHKGNNSILNEPMLMSRFNHENIIPFIGYCDEGDGQIIVTEYASRGSLKDHLKDADKIRCITWAQHLQICLGVARGIEYLHSGLGEGNKVIHRGVISSNIWLHDNLEAKLSGFRMSVSLPRDQPYVYDYLFGASTDPIYAQSGILKAESDLYSFGVLMFEMLSGMLVYNQKSIGDVKPQSLLQLVHRYYDVGLDNLIDPHIRDQMDRGSLHMLTETAYKCISINITERPCWAKFFWISNVKLF